MPRCDDAVPTEHETRPSSEINRAQTTTKPRTSRSAKREAFTDVAQPHRGPSRSASPRNKAEGKDLHTITTLPKTPGPSISRSRKRSTKPEHLAAGAPPGKENTPSPPRSLSGKMGLGFMTPTRARTLVGHLLERDAMQVPPSPASSSELSPVGQDMMNNLRKQRMHARQAERRRGIWVRE
ncbi:hypothetical protein BC628DRAFT_1330750 [Trametes gibbosa]|nr:hypothetical protein BC628DRAFT_1330750 [Trametes gibbosa]